MLNSKDENSIIAYHHLLDFCVKVEVGMVNIAQTKERIIYAIATEEEPHVVQFLEQALEYVENCEIEWLKWQKEGDRVSANGY
jgi:GDP-D-mannose dehydratase